MDGSAQRDERDAIRPLCALFSRLRNLPRADTASLILFAIAIIVVILTFRDYGYAWDGVFNRHYGKLIWDFFASLGKDRRALEAADRGGMFDATTELIVRISPFPEMSTHQLVTAVIGLIGVLGCWRTARLLGGPAAGFWAALFLLVTAPYYGHMFINIRDIPLAAGYIWAIYFLIRFISELPTPASGTRVGFGVALGASVGARPGGILILPYFLLLAAGDAASHWHRTRQAGASLRRVGRAVLLGLPSFALAYLLMIALWPAALLHPFTGPLAAMRSSQHFRQYGWLLWNGRWIDTLHLPWTYLPVVFGVELPEPLVVLLVAALPWALFAAWRATRRGDRTRAIGLAILPVAALFPPIYAVATRATIYDNMRHFLFVVPPLMCIAALAWAALLEAARRRQAAIRYALVGVMPVLLLHQVQRSAWLHPYEYAFKNLFAGGMPAAERKFDTEYWITSYKEAVALMKAHAREIARKEGVPFESRRFVVAVTGLADVVALQKPDNFAVFEFDPRRMGDKYQPSSDYVITMTRARFAEMSPRWPIAGTVGRLGMTFSVVKVNPALPVVTVPANWRDRR